MGAIGMVETGVVGMVETGAKGTTETGTEGVAETGATSVAREMTIGSAMLDATHGSSKVSVSQKGRYAK